MCMDVTSYVCVWDPLPPRRGDRRGAAGLGSRGVGAGGPQKLSPVGLER